ncbi:MAG: T9SS type A sorting domain-containing protein [bacterium]
MKTKLFLTALFLLALAGLERAKANDIDTVWMRWTHNVKHIDISSDSKYIVTNDDGNAIVRDLITGDELYSINSIIASKFSPDGKFIFGLYNNQIVVFDIESKQKRTDIEFSEYDIGQISFSKDGNKLLASYANKAGVGIWDIETGEKIDEILVTDGLEGWERFFTGKSYFIENDGQILFTYSKYKNVGRPDQILSIHILKVDILTKNILFNQNFHNNQTILSNDRTKFFAYPNSDNKLEFYSVNDLTKLFDIPCTYTDQHDIAFSPDDNYLAVTYRSLGKIIIYSLETKEEVYFYNMGTYHTVAFSPNGKYVAGSVGPVLVLHFTYNWYNSVPENIIQTTITYPNPTMDSFNLEFDLIQNNNTMIDIVDLLGNVVKTIDNQYLSVGHHLYNVNIEDIPIGTYTLRIISGNFSFNAKIVKI